ncbi:MAG: SDR family NAD(P)-dependent oxidoreductase, partial [Archangium sp.]|nr:SDR family NAD(P)-dependent oxidoreductase [Archangium sp.]
MLHAVSEATGYPRETLSLGMELEADLGIDSIKRVEILSLVSKRLPNAPTANPEKLAGLRTLQQVCDFVGGSAPVVSSPPPPSNSAEVVLQAVSEATGYPRETLSLGMELEADLGIDSIKRVEILSLVSKRLPGAPTTNPEKLAGLRTLQQVCDFVSSSPAPDTAPLPPPRVVASQPALPRRVVVPVRAPRGAPAPWPAGEVVVVGDDAAFNSAVVEAFRKAGHTAQILNGHPAPSVGTLVLVAPMGPWTSERELALKRQVLTVRTLSPQLRNARGQLVAVSRRDGAFGHAAPALDGDELQSGLAGLAKTMSHEWPEVRCRAIDLSTAFSPSAAAEELVRELGTDSPLEVGLAPGRRVTLALRTEAASPKRQRIERDDVIIVTGGARGVTAVCATELARRHGTRLVLLGRSPAPDVEAPWLAQAGDEASIKRALLEHAPADARPTPRQLGDACRNVLAAREIRSTLSALEKTGVTAVYRAVDVRDADAVRLMLDDVRATLGPVRGLVHGAGVLRDKRLEDKRDDDIDAVVDTKLSGLRVLLEAMRGDALRFVALFASVSGRFGRRGQVDYALANQALVSIAQVESRRRADCRVVAFDWGPWEGGMVTSALKAEFEREGVPLIPLQAGADAFCDEVATAPGGPTEIVFGAGFGEAVTSSDGWAQGFTTTLDASWPVLADHRLAGRAVLPLAVSMEWLLTAALRVSGSAPSAMEDVRVLKGVTAGPQTESVS